MSDYLEQTCKSYDLIAEEYVRRLYQTDVIIQFKKLVHVVRRFIGGVCCYQARR